MMLKTVSLGDRYDLDKDRILLSGVQALVRVTLMQKEMDRRAGLNTAGYVTGYRGSPLGTVDLQFERAGDVLKASDIMFQAGLNEEMAATALWGAQQAEMRGEGIYDGVFGMWYGKGPGVDRSGDVFRHANAAGTSKHGGVLVLMGDDHMAESSTVAHQSEFALVDVMMPVLNPSGVQELIDYGLIGIAMSRYAGCWVGLKCVHDNVESTAVVSAGMDRVAIRLPDDFTMPQGGLNIRPVDDRLEQEKRLHTHKRFAAVAFARANGLDRIVLNGGRAPRIGIATCGKSYLDTMQALDELGIGEAEASRLGIRLLKLGMVWPIDPKTVERFADGLDLIIVVEEKRSLIETQLREQLYGARNQPVIIGKRDEEGNPLFAAYGSLEPHQIAVALGERLLGRKPGAELRALNITETIAALKQTQERSANLPQMAKRIPYFCAGCPHNTSTTVPEGGRGYAGIGCHWMVQFIPERHTQGATQMGGEGANWIGEAPFSKRKHVFQNLGDGTYNHSGILAIRAAIAAKVNITFKLLYNDAVAMTGGQAHDGGLTVEMIARQMVAEGISRLAVVSDEPGKYGPDAGFPGLATFHHRSELDAVQRELMETEGVTGLIYDQTCAAEKRRRRKRGTYPDPARRVVINELVCEGCGDCGIQSNCVAIEPVESEFGRKRQINQSICNKDFSCLNGFCPSFVTVEGGRLKKGQGVVRNGDGAHVFEALPEPAHPGLDKPYAILITGIGGTGVVTIGALLGMAAYLEGKGAGIIDMAGLAQKNGAVSTHLKIAARPEDISAIRVSAGQADLLLGCDLVATAADEILATAARGRTRAVVNAHETMPAQFTRMPDFKLGAQDMKLALEARLSQGGISFVDATALATALLGDAIASNLFTLGYAYQKGLIPVSAGAIEQAIALNGVAVEMNKQAFAWGRRAAHAPERVARLAEPEDRASHAKSAKNISRDLDEMIARRVAFLTAYQNAAYARRYSALVDRVRAAEAMAVKGGNDLTTAVARYLFKLMAYKDEYEVARLYTDGSFAQNIADRFEGDYKVKLHLAPPLLARRDAQTGHLQKREFGPWVLRAFKLLARCKGLRGTALDIFGYSGERSAERRLIADYEAMLDEILAKISTANHGIAVALAALPEHVRGYGHVKAAAIGAHDARREELLAAFRSGKSLRQAAE